MSYPCIDLGMTSICGRRRHPGLYGGIHVSLGRAFRGFERLRANAARARSGERATVLVGGEAGIGKSRLVSEAVSASAIPMIF
jgi:predicted ATPase